MLASCISVQSTTRSISRCHCRSFASAQVRKQRDVMQEIGTQIRDSKCVVYMRGDRNKPTCKFSKAVVDALNSVGTLSSTFHKLCLPEFQELSVPVKKYIGDILKFKRMYCILGLAILSSCVIASVSFHRPCEISLVVPCALQFLLVSQKMWENLAVTSILQKNVFQRRTSWPLTWRRCWIQDLWCYLWLRPQRSHQEICVCFLFRSATSLVRISAHYPLILESNLPLHLWFYDHLCDYIAGIGRPFRWCTSMASSSEAAICCSPITWIKYWRRWFMLLANNFVGHETSNQDYEQNPHE